MTKAVLQSQDATPDGVVAKIEIDNSPIAGVDGRPGVGVIVTFGDNIWTMIVPGAEFEEQLQRVGYYRLDTVLQAVQHYVEDRWHKEQTTDYKGPVVIGHPNTITGQCPYCSTPWYDMSFNCCADKESHGHVVRSITGVATCSYCKRDVSGDNMGRVS